MKNNLRYREITKLSIDPMSIETSHLREYCFEMINGLNCPQGMDGNHRSSRSMIVCVSPCVSVAEKELKTKNLKLWSIHALSIIDLK